MCGIAGALTGIAGRSHVEGMTRALAAMAHRGPNDRGMEVVPDVPGEVILGQTRLSVIDLSSGGHQPMWSPDRRLGIVFNGEIYNYVELREELAAVGAQFQTKSDTEVLLKAWEMWGDACLPRLGGMFAFAVLDRERRDVTCVRDPFGIKPLYLCSEDGRFLFASEMPAIRALRGGQSKVNWQVAHDYLVHGDYDSSSATFVEGITHLPPGHMVRVPLNGSSSKITRWWHASVTPVNREISFEDAAVALRDRLLDSVRLQLRSDVPLGAALSGGLDSSAIVCAIRQVARDLPIHTFSFVARGSQLSEERWVDEVNHHVGAIPHKVIIEPNELVRDLEDMIVAQGEPFGSTSIYAQYRVFKLARDHGVTVTLDGQGADEMLAGYIGYPAKRFHSLVDEGKWVGGFSFLKAWSSWPARNMRDGARSAIGELLPDAVHRWLRQRRRRRRPLTWLDQDKLEENGVELDYAVRHPPLDAPGRRLAAELAFSLTERGLPALLRHGDRNSMRFSVESRVPFLDAGLADFLLTLPEDYLISENGETKRILRRAMRGIVPDAILDRRDKVGFATPEREWLGLIAHRAREWLSEDLGMDFVNRHVLVREFDSMIAGETPFSWQAWRWINFCRWYASEIVAY
jgi:asparagine synthase (glutamine-hydrolysing)